MSSDQYAYIELKDFNGCYMPSDFSTAKEDIRKFEVRNEDIWVTSYPKAGTTWLQEMVWLIANDLDYKGAEVNVDVRYPYLEMNCLMNESTEFKKKYKPEALNKYVIPDFIKVLNETPGRRMIKTHLPWFFLPKDIQDGLKTPKIIHVIRDPRSVVVSWYHHSATLFPIYQGTIEKFVDLFIEGKLLYGNYYITVESYLEQKHLPNLLILTYEDMYKDIKSAIKSVCQFLGKSYKEDEIAKLTEHLSFDKMKNNKAVNRQGMIKDENKSFMRKGNVDSYKRDLSEDSVEKLNKWISKNDKRDMYLYENKLC